jgi:hypothetical protein
MGVMNPLVKRITPILAVVLLSSCASMQRSQDQGSIRLFADLINSGKPEKLAQMSARPFLVDREIVALPADVATFWQGLVKAGFRVGETEMESASPLSADSYRLFSNSMEVKTFFSKYVSKNARLLEMRTSTGQRILLVAGDEWMTKKIYGFKGPF